MDRLNHSFNKDYKFVPNENKVEKFDLAVINTIKQGAKGTDRIKAAISICEECHLHGMNFYKTRGLLLAFNLKNKPYLSLYEIEQVMLSVFACVPYDNRISPEVMYAIINGTEKEKMEEFAKLIIEECRRIRKNFEEIEGILYVWSLRCQEPLTQKQLKEIIDSAYAKNKKQLSAF